MSDYTQLSFDLEIWKPVPGWETMYEVSNHGRVRRRWSIHTRKTSVNKYGYVTLILHAGTIHKHVTVHALVMAAFVGPCPDGLEINHIDGDKSNNHPENLEYVTRSENTIHALRIGLRQPIDPSHPGESNGRAKLTDDDVRTIRRLYKNGNSQVSLGKQFGVSHIAIGFIVRGVHWKHVK